MVDECHIRQTMGGTGVCVCARDRDNKRCCRRISRPDTSENNEERQNVIRNSNQL